MPPVYVEDERDLIPWIEGLVRDAGATWLPPGSPSCESLIFTTAGDDESYSVGIPTQEVEFYSDQSRLKIALQAIPSDIGWSYPKYSFHYRTTTNPCVFRYDKHPERWFEREHGTDCHVHCGSDRRTDMHPTPLVELDFVLQRVADFQVTGAIPSH